MALMLATVLPLFGQTSQEISSITFYGIDYSLVRVYGASESPTQFRFTFGEINDLFISQPKKFDISKFTGKKLDEISLDAVNEVNQKLNLHDLVTTTPDYTLDATQITQAVRRLPIKKGAEGTGAVIVAKLLKKADNRATYESGRHHHERQGRRFRSAQLLGRLGLQSTQRPSLTNASAEASEITYVHK